LGNVEGKDHMMGLGEDGNNNIKLEHIFFEDVNRIERV
jgi:hypothetical protein